VFQFGAFEVNEETGELRKHGIRIKLHSQPFKVLLLLLETPGAIVSRKQLQQRLWGDGTFVDFEHGLNTAINKIREALDDSASQPRYLETIPGKGYRFIAPVTPPSTPQKLPVIEVNPRLKASPLLEVNEDWLTRPHELPRASPRVVKTLLLLIQLMYLAFYFSALANLQEIREILLDLPWPSATFAILVMTASLLIPVRLFLGAAVTFDFPLLPEKFRRLFPFLLPMDLLWSTSPFLLIHHITMGLALGLFAVLAYVPFAQRSLVLMYGLERS
jgi:DNA-binding winged helix-turn-helix (wHTH) protein